MNRRRTIQYGALAICGAIIEIGCLTVVFGNGPVQQVRNLLFAYLITGATFGWLIWRLAAARGASWSAEAVLVIIIGAVLFRVTLFPLAPASSPDVHRYLWEGLVQHAGENPYVCAPDDPTLATLAAEHADLHAKVTFKDMGAIYPPTAQWLFWLNAVLFGGSFYGWKLILLLFDGLLAWAVWLLLRGTNHAPAGLLAVLWCPLLLFETYEAGHLDLIGAALVAVGLVAVLRRKLLWGGIALGLALNVKYLWPLVLIGAVFWRIDRWRSLVAFGGGVLLAVAFGWLGYRDGISEAFATVRMFAESWTFNDIIFEGLRKLPGPRWMSMLLVLIALCALAALCALRRPARLWADAWLLVGAALLLSPVAYPWYFLWLLPGLALRPPLWLVVWLVSVPALHLVHWHEVATGGWDPMAWLWPIVDLVPAILLVRAWWRRLREPEHIPALPAAKAGAL